MAHRGKEAPWTRLEPRESPGTAITSPGLALLSDLGAGSASGQTGGAHTQEHAACCRPEGSWEGDPAKPGPFALTGP